MNIFGIFSPSQEHFQQAEDLLRRLKSNKTLPTADYKQLLEFAHAFLEMRGEDEQAYNLGLSIICHSCENCPSDAFLLQLLHECICASRVFLYNDMLAKRNNSYIESISSSIFQEFSQAHYTLETETVLTKEQKILFDTFKEKKRIIVSAPTSFGKSRIVQEIIIHGDYSNIAIVLPTIALLNEIYLKFKNNPYLQSYKLITLVNGIVLGGKNIFILTPERMDMLLDQMPDLKIDFFTMDEIYKIQDDPDRKEIFTHCLYRLTKFDTDFYLIGPYFNGFSAKFLEQTQSHFIKFTGEIVQKDAFDLTEIQSGDQYSINGNALVKLKSNDSNLLKIVEALPEQTLIYLGRKDTVETRAKRIAAKKQAEVSNDLIEYIEENISDEWSLVNCLKKGVAFHHSAIPKYIQSEIVDAFNDGDIGTIVCTTTLTEGVNTSAKNVIISDSEKGGKELSGFDVKNIKGRAGRFFVHFVGNVYMLVPVKTEADKGVIEFSYFDNPNLNSEEVVQIDKKELNDQNLRLRENIENQLKAENIPFSLIKSNKFIPVHNQVRLIQFLRSSKEERLSVSFGNQLPDKEHFERILYLCHEYLFNNGDKDNRKFSIGELSRQTKYYIYMSPRIKALISNQNGAKIDTKIRGAFTLITHWFEFALPRYFTAFQNIFNFVAPSFGENEINLSYLITKLEFGFNNHHEIAFKEAGLPNDIIHKIEKNFRDCNSIEEIRTKLRYNPFLLNPLSDFEKKIFNKYI